MKDWLILLCIGIIAFLLFQERGRWTAQKTTQTPTAPAVVTPVASPPKGEVVSANPPSPGGQPAPIPAEKDTQANLVIESQRAALARYPALGVPNSELNLRFTYRYKNLVADHSPRLQDPAWPLQLADECARDAGSRPVAQVPTPSPTAPPKTAALPVSLTAPANAPAPSLRIQQSAAAVPQTLVFHPGPGGAPQVPPASAIAPATPKPNGALPFVTLDAVNQSSGNHFTYNYYSGWWYDISFRQSVGIAINVRNMGREAAAVNVRWLFFARRGHNGERFVFGAAGQELDLAPGEKTDIPAVSPVVQSREINDYWWNGTRYLSGSKYEGWLVQLVERGGSSRVIKQTGSTSYLEDLAKRTDFSDLIEKFKHGQTDGSLVQ